MTSVTGLLESRFALAGALALLAVAAVPLVVGGWSNVNVSGLVFAAGAACLLWLSGRSEETSPSSDGRTRNDGQKLTNSVIGANSSPDSAARSDWHY